MKRNKFIKISVTILLILLPFLDMLRTTDIRHFELFGISIVEIFNIMLIGGAFIVTLTKCNKKQIIGIICYLFLISIYIILHYNHIITFDKNIFQKANFNFITETFYICRVYLLPLALLFVLMNNRDIFDKTFYFRIIKIVIFIISGSIVILDILKISYISYSDTHNFVVNNLFDYFLYQGDFRLLSARVWFDSANELSAIMFMLFPINIYLLYKEGNKNNWMLFIVQFIAMILLGTRTSAVGSVLVVATSFIVYLILILFGKNEMNVIFLKRFSIISLICITFFTISPFMISRLNEGKADFSVRNVEAYSELSVERDKSTLSKLFEKYKDEYLINELFLKLYPFENDIDFWIKIASRNKVLNNNSRIMKTDIIRRIKERNNNTMDTYLGMGYTLNMMDLERDYVYQYYLFGIIGVILLMSPYFVIFIYICIKCFKYFKKNFNFETILCLMGPLLGMLIAYYSGHVFGWVSPMMWLVVTLSLIFIIVRNNCNKDMKDIVKLEKENIKKLKKLI